MNIVEHMKRRREDLDMYWNATRFLWRVFTHPKNPKSVDAQSAGRKIATPYRVFITPTIRAQPAADDHARGSSGLVHLHGQARVQTSRTAMNRARLADAKR